MILADSSVWIGHLRKGDPQLADLLLREQIVMHTVVLGELACGSLKDRERVLLLVRGRETFDPHECNMVDPSVFTEETTP